MRRLLVLTAVTVLLLGVGSNAVPVAAAGGPNPTTDCDANTRLTRSYTVAQLRNALATMPADIKEYSNCYDLIQRQLLAQLGGVRNRNAGGRGGSGGSFLPTPVLVVLVVLVLAAATFGALALRRRGK